MTKTAEEIISNYNNVEFDSTGEPVYSYNQIISILKEYALQEVKKHLEIAANEAKTVIKPAAVGVSDNPYVVIDKESITGIKIELT